MITEIQIENYKSIQNLKMNLGRVNVFIGENGCGKSNILEAIALASAAANNKLDNEYLAPRGIRNVEPQFMRSAFEEENLQNDIKINLKVDDGFELKFELNHDNQPYSKWVDKGEIPHSSYIGSLKYLNELMKKSPHDLKLLELINDDKRSRLIIQELSSGFPNLQTFFIYSPENTSLRKLEEEGQIRPLGIKGEGLFKLLKVISDENQDQINEIKEKLKLLDWFEDFEIAQGSFGSENRIQIRDRYLDENLPFFDQRSSNEGFLFLMFYFTLFISNYTSKFFAIDNIDASLNPKLCTRLIKELVELAKKYNKQVILTTHNPAILDGLNLGDDEQRLFEIYRSKSGSTKAQRITKPEPLAGEEPFKLSEAFMRGYIGGLPKNF